MCFIDGYILSFGISNLLFRKRWIMELKEEFYNIFNNQIVGGSVVLIKGENEFKYNYGYSSLVD
jgi:hypothetical protein